MMFKSVVSCMLAAVPVFAQTLTLQAQTVFPEANPHALIARGGRVELINDKDVPFKFVVENTNEFDVNILAYTGSFVEESAKGDVTVANLSTTPVGPLVIAAGETAELDQTLRVVLPLKNLALDFVLLASVPSDEESTVHTIDVAREFVVVGDEPISMFDPRFLLIVVTIGSAACYFGYKLMRGYVIPFIDPSAKEVKEPPKASPLARPGPAGGWDEKWIPQQHLKRRSAKKDD